MADNFTDFYEAALTGWAERRADHWKSDWNPRGIVSWLWRRELCDLDIHPVHPARGETGRMQYQAEIEGDSRNLGIFDCLTAAQEKCEQEYERRFAAGGSRCPHCGKAIRLEAAKEKR